MRGKRRYWVCVDTGNLGEIKNISMLKRAIVVAQVGNVQMTDRGRTPTIYGTEIWVEISEEQYQERLDNPGGLFCYDGIHSIGSCRDCKCFHGYRASPILSMRNKKLYIIKCSSEDRLYESNLTSDADWLHSCCIAKENEED